MKSTRSIPMPDPPRRRQTILRCMQIAAWAAAKSTQGWKHISIHAFHTSLRAYDVQGTTAYVLLFSNSREAKPTYIVQQNLEVL